MVALRQGPGKKKMTVPKGRFFANIFSIFDGSEPRWNAISVGIHISGSEGTQLFRLHISTQNSIITKGHSNDFNSIFLACDGTPKSEAA